MTYTMDTPRSYNFSGIKTALRCHRLYKYLYIDKLTPEKGPTGDLLFGSAMHAAMEAAFTGDDALSAFNTYWEYVGTKTPDFGRLGYEALQDVGQTLVPRFVNDHVPKFTPKSVETRLYGVLSDVKVEGTPDFVGLYDGVPSIVDFKTSGQPYDKGKIRVDEQMYLYAHLARTELKYDVQQLVYKVFIKSTKRIQTLVHPLDEAEYQDILASILEHCRDLEKRQSWPANRGGCLAYGGRCEFFNKCYPKSS